MMVWLLLAAVRVVRDGDTVESIAGDVGIPAQADELRRINGLGPGEQPRADSVLELPPGVQGVVCQPSYVRHLTGTGEVLRPGSAGSEPMVERMPLPVESKVCTGLDGYATLRLAVDLGDATWDEVTLMPGSCLIVRGSYGSQGGRTSVVTLARGEVLVPEARVAAGAVVVETDAGMTLGEGGGFRVAVEPDATRTEAVTAEVLTTAQGVKVAIPEGFGGRTIVGEGPGQPVALMPAPRLVSPTTGDRLHRPDFYWDSPAPAFAWYVEFSTTPDFSAIVRQQVVAASPWQAPGLSLPEQAPGIYWRVYGVDRASFLHGLPSEPAWILFPHLGHVPVGP